MSYILLILLLLILAVFVLPIIILVFFFFIKRNSIMNVSEVMNSILYKFVNENTTTNNENDMSQSEALKILGLTEDAKSNDINQAYRNLMKSIHPDNGGSAYLAQKLNEARDLLLNKNK